MEQNPVVTREANRLYWQTDTSIADIAEKLSVSRRALYELVQPENAGISCSACGGAVEFVNRSAKASAVGRCKECGAECPVGGEVDDVEEVVPPYAAGWPRAVPLSRTPGDDLRVRALKIGGIALAGAALGAAAAMLIMRRR